ncbi:alkaline phosphatase D family protein [Lutimonas halocynthiae]|uniref:alkaline phosphatase D family protein n=1 Tax=Lutimonas halocynthiae TaxID=1446477 RepID=UPI0025B36442|nr:alkaline phosphatase D family protein [Lutimonas halocynthiae]MDN3644257.1 alkaline phosphatase D family protein [Lutimonas halocynthiae]
MKYFSFLLLCAFTLLGCAEKNEFVLSFASCNNQNVQNNLWEPILSHHPDLFIWGGDIIYSDTEDMKYMTKNYAKMKSDSSYINFTKKVPILGTWDDHDYGLNDGGANYKQKDSVQQIFLDFFDIPLDDPRRIQKGIYFAKEIEVKDASIKIIILDTRFFRSDLSKDPTGIKRYIPNDSDSITMLGASQWQWLEKELSDSKAQFNVIMSSIQLLSYEHGFESWGTMPQEVKKMEDILSKSKARGIIFLSGDRHIAEISSKNVEGLDFPLIDMTSSGMTHSYDSFKGEPNPYRVTEVVPYKNFGILKFDFDKNQVTMEIRGEENVLYQSIEQKY